MANSQRQSTIGWKDESRESWGLLEHKLGWMSREVRLCPGGRSQFGETQEVRLIPAEAGDRADSNFREWSWRLAMGSEK